MARAHDREAGFTVQWVFALAMLGTLAFVGLLLLEEEIQAAQEGAATLTLTGEQDALALRTAVLGDRLVLVSGAEREALRSELLLTSDHILANHLALTDPEGTAGGHLPAAVAALYFEPPVMLDEAVRGVAAESAALARAPDAELTDANPHLQALRDGSERVHVAMARVLDAYEAETVSSVGLLRGFEYWTLGTTLLMLMVTGLFVYRPMGRRIREEVGRLEDLNATLERRVANRTADLEARTRALSRSNADLEQFAYVASHDLQEPLRMVASYVQLLQHRYKGRLDPDADEYIGFAVEGVRRMQDLIQDLLAYARLGTRAPAPVPVDATKAVAGALRNLEVAMREAGAEVKVGDLPMVLGEEGQLVQLFQNLLGNALKFRGPEPPRLQVRASRDRPMWRFEVQDNGIGIAPEHHERIFVIFQRLHARREYEGTGMGLAICKRIVERYGGTIGVDSEEGKGSTFWFRLPAVDQPVKPAEEPARPAVDHRVEDIV